MSRQPDFSTGPRRAAVHARWEDVLVASAVVALVASASVAYRARGEAREAVTRTAEARRQLEDQKARLHAMAPASSDASAGAAEASPRRIVGAIASVLPPDARLSRLSIDYKGGVAVEMQVDARRASSWDRLLEGMARSPDFAEVEPGPEEREAEVRTTLRARWIGGAR